MAGTLTKGGYGVPTTQYTPPATDLSNYAPKYNTFTGTLSAGTIAASFLSYVDSTTQAATDVMTEIHTINERYNNSVNHLTTEQQNAFNNWVGSTTGESVGIGGEVGLTLWEMYHMNNVKKQVTNCVQYIQKCGRFTRGGFRYVRNALTGLYY